MKILRIKNRRNSLATNSSSTHSVVYKNKDQVFEDLGIFDNNYYDRCTETIAASREAKIRYIYANIFRHDELVEMMAERYPEMKEYFPLAKNHIEIYCNEEKRKEIYEHRDEDDYWDLWDELNSYMFGEHSRGALYNSNELQLSYEYLCNIIDSPDIVIVGGSDENDFVSDTIEGCQKLSKNYSYLKNITEKVKNGNYYILYGEMYNRKEKLRLQVDSIPEMIPQYPELVDIKITDACEHACPFCYMGSTAKGKHASLYDICDILSLFKTKTEFAIGGGNVLLHPFFSNIVKYISADGHIANITIRYDDAETIESNNEIKEAIKSYVSGIGLSVQKSEDVEVASEFIKEMLEMGKHVSLHVIPEMIGVDETMSILNKIKEINNELIAQNWLANTCKVLFLGLKQSGRAKNMEHKLLTADELTEMAKVIGYQFNVDTAFINTYDEWFKEVFNGDDEYFLTRHEGEYSMFIDAVKMQAFTSSYKDDGGIAIGSESKLDDVFGQIRYKNGFKVFERPDRYFRK